MIAKAIFKNYRAKYGTTDGSFYMYADGRRDYDQIKLSPHSSVAYVASSPDSSFGGYRFARCKRPSYP